MQIRSDTVVAHNDFVRQSMASEVDRRRQDVRKLQRVEDSKRSENRPERERSVGRNLDTKA